MRWVPRLVDDLMRSPHVTSVTSLWTAPAPERAALVSSDGRSGLIVAGIAGDENKTQEYAKDLSDAARPRQGLA